MKFEELGKGHSEDSIDNPCIRNCCLDDNDICLGCFRTLDEMLHWSSSTIHEKKQILANCMARKAVRKVSL
ncbi:DUF1289 domain-containing protein [Vibrio parahaemolyticus]|uniref:DUF1289 domain-containing protein n=1 Tax=Vibrio parahaemolyticus TaxID=670 RepID=UPI0009B1A767|nr:DUF1289 domain-containing protein [Vibrio parahaemolyticus]ELB2122224.1 DUF1289 domain-containing protein [Vibrio parahaemolyticus]MBE4066496.1 DUF1289 domain-containing protein [Vibrio parahaemolyticus]MBE4488795.1 DUF1289 domain-containing protein [Vibrio parahaemolyticus]MBE4493053.1 DUF1289 domain-containing protein [Vibrio parahaemolyticus]MBE4502515.1 DUF1289 domain-containing protein [Vibrio parahaemolyticus]